MHIKGYLYYGGQISILLIWTILNNNNTPFKELWNPKKPL